MPDVRSVVTDDGVTIRYRASGTGSETLILVHGWCSNSSHFRPQIDVFSEDHRVLAVDRRGHGESDIPTNGYSAQRHAADLSALFDQEGIESAVIVGHAGGCPTVLDFASNHANRTRAIVLLDTRISPASDLTGSDRTSPLAMMVAAIEDDDTFANIYRGFVSDRSPELRERIVEDALRVPRWVAQADLASIAIDTVALARDIRCPVLWLSVDAPDEDFLRSTFLDVRLRQCPDSGHFVHLEAADLINRSIREFLEELSGDLPRVR